MAIITRVDSEKSLNRHELPIPSITIIEDTGRVYYRFKPESEIELGILDNMNRIILSEELDRNTTIVRYEDSTCTPLDGYACILLRDFVLNSQNIFPYHASKIGFYSFKGNRLGGINLSKTSYGTRNYRFGILSDIHYNDDDPEDHTIIEDLSSTEWHSDYINAASFLNNKEDVEFTCISGDMTTDNITHVMNFHKLTEKYSDYTPVYTCKGNHDNKAAYGNDELWKEYTFPKENSYEVYFYSPEDPENIRISESSVANSYYFLRGSDVFIFLSVDYGRDSNTASSSTYQYYDPNSLVWFQKVLDEYRNQRCFVFTHLFFPKKAGNYREYYTASTQHKAEYYLTGTQHDLLNNLNNYYQNSIWFTGHSHYKWYLQGTYSKANITNYDSVTHGTSAWNVHIPSCSNPLEGIAKYCVLKNESEGGIVDVYDNYIDIRGVEFKTATSVIYGKKKTSQASYITPEDLIPNTSRSGYDGTQTAEIDSEGYLSLKFTQTSQEFLIRTPYPDFSSKTHVCYLYIEDAKTIQNEEETGLIHQSNPYIGFYQEYQGTYTLSNCFGYYVTGAEGEAGIRITCSSDLTKHFPGITVSVDNPLYLKLKVKALFAELPYTNKYSPLAQYRLEVGGKNLKEIDHRDYSDFNN